MTQLRLVSAAMALAPLALASLAFAQNPLGTITNVGTTWATRGLSAASEQNAATLFTRYDSDVYAGYTTAAAPNMRQVKPLQTRALGC